MKIEERLFSIADVAERLGMSTYTIRDWIAAGRLKATRIGRFWRVKEPDLEAFIDRPPPVNMAAVRQSSEVIEKRRAEEAERLQSCRSCGERIEQPGRRKFYGEFSLPSEEGEEPTRLGNLCERCVTIDPPKRKVAKPFRRQRSAPR
jgi:excisionase family DNA binding protein